MKDSEEQDEENVQGHFFLFTADDRETVCVSPKTPQASHTLLKVVCTTEKSFS